MEKLDQPENLSPWIILWSIAAGVLALAFVVAVVVTA